MSFNATRWAWEEGSREVGGYDLLVLLALADSHNHRTGQCNPSIGHIAEKIGVCNRTVMRALEALEKACLIAREKTPGGGNQYVLTSVTESLGVVTESHLTSDSQSPPQPYLRNQERNRRIDMPRINPVYDTQELLKQYLKARN